MLLVLASALLFLSHASHVLLIAVHIKSWIAVYVSGF